MLISFVYYLYLLFFDAGKGVFPCPVEFLFFVFLFFFFKTFEEKGRLIYENNYSTEGKEHTHTTTKKISITTLSLPPNRPYPQLFVALLYHLLKQNQLHSMHL